MSTSFSKFRVEQENSLDFIMASNATGDVLLCILPLHLGRVSSSNCHDSFVVIGFTNGTVMIIRFSD
jgi:hypothetical protein